MSIQRLRDLSLQLGLEQATAAFADLADSDAAQRNVWIRGTSAAILQALDASRVSPPADAAEKWERLAPILIGLEQLSARELAHLNVLAGQAGDAARAKLDTLRLTLLLQIRTTVAMAAPSAADSAGFTNEHLVARLQRRLSADARAVVLAAARELQRDLFERLAQAADAWYPVACAADEIMRASQQTAGGADRFAAMSLVTRLAARREWFQRQARSSGEDGTAPSGIELGALAHALGATAVRAALHAVRASDLPALSPLAEFKTAASDAAQNAVGQAWMACRRGIVESVDEHVATAFADLAGEMDGWFTDVRHAGAVLCGRSAEVDERIEAARFEITDIWRQAAGHGRPAETT